MRDSLRPCNPQDYSTQFQIHDHPDYKAAPIRATPSTSKDTIEVFRNDLKQEALHRLRHTSDSVVYQKMAVVIRIGKYLFLAAALPPYLLLYSIPKWIVIEGIIPLFQTFVSIASKIQKTVSERLELVAEKLTQILERLRGTMRGLISPIFKLAGDISNALKKMYDHVATLFARMAQFKLPSFRPSFRLGKAISNKMNQVRTRLRQAVSHTVTRARNQLQDFFMPLTEKIATSLIFTKQLLKKLNPLTRLKALRNFIPARPPLPQALPQALKHSRQLAEQITTFIAQKMHAAGQLMQTYVKTFSSGPSKIWSRLRQALRDRRQGSMNHFKRKLSEIKKRINFKELQALVPPILYRWIPPSIRQVILDYIKKLFANPIIRQLFTGISSLSKVLKKSVLSCLDSLRLLLRWLRSSLKAFGTLCWKFVPPVSDRVKLCLKKALYHSLVFLFMMSILTAWGLKLVGETAGFAIRAVLSNR